MVVVQEFDALEPLAHLVIVIFVLMVWRVVQAPPPEDKHADKKAGATKTGDKK